LKNNNNNIVTSECEPAKLELILVWTKKNVENQFRLLLGPSHREWPKTL